MATVKAISVRASCLTLKQRSMSASLGRACVRVCVYARVAASDMPCCSDAGVVFTDALMCAHEVSDPVPLVIVNGRASDFRSEGSEFESPCPHVMSGCVRALLLANGNERVIMLRGVAVRRARRPRFTMASVIARNRLRCQLQRRDFQP